MRFFLTIIFFFPFCISLSAQNSNDTFPETSVHLIYEGEKPVELRVFDLSFYPFQKSRSRVIKFDNTQRIQKINFYNQQAQLNYSFVSFVANDTIHFNINDKGTFLLRGKDKDKQNYLDYRNIHFISNYYMPVIEKLRSTTSSIDDYRRDCIALFKKDSIFIDSFFYASKKYQPLKEEVLNNARFNLISMLMQYPHKKDIREEKDDYLPVFYVNEILNSQIYNSDRSTSLSKYIAFLDRKNIDDSGVKKILSMISNAKETLPADAYNYWTMTLLDSYSRTGLSTMKPVVEDIYNTLVAHRFSNDIKKEIKDKYQKYIALQKELEIYGNIKLKRGDGKEVLFKEIITEKNLTFIDFWASWCASCIDELPELRKRKEENSRYAHFISISIDAKEENWKKALKKHNMDLLSSYRFADMNNKMIKDFNIQSIPRFFLVDITGKVLHADMPRPSEKVYFEKTFYSFLK